MISSKAAILGRIREALGERPTPPSAEYGVIVRQYRSAARLDQASRERLFAERLQHYDVLVSRCTRNELSMTIGQALEPRGRKRIVIPDDFPPKYLPEDAEFISDTALSYTELDRVDGVLTGCSLGIALTGTIVLTHARAEGRRALTLIPDYHLCIVGVDQIVGTVPEAIRQIRIWNPALVTTISGPSATSDIEMTRIRGVHGPRTLDVILVGAD